MRFIPTTVHAMLDYLVGLVLILAPLLWIEESRIGAAIPMILGAGIIVYSLLTRYEFGLAGLIPVPVHLLLDGLGGAFLAVSPWLFGFSDVIWAPHVIIGVLEIGVALVTFPRAGEARPAAGAQPPERPARDPGRGTPATAGDNPRSP